MLVCSAAWADTGRLYIRHVVFEPRSEKQALKIQPGASINSSGVREAAETIRKQLMENGYREASVKAELVPAGARQVDLRLTVDRGPRYRVEQVQFTGDTALRPAELKRALRPYHVPYCDGAIRTSLARLQSLYVSRGYFDAQVRLAQVQTIRPRVALTFSVQPGPRYRVHGGDFPAPEICRCLLDARRQAEHRGVLDFGASVQLEPSAGPNQLSFVSRTDPGLPYTVGRIEFRGNHRFGDLTLRRAIALDEGVLFDWERLRRSVGRLNQLNLFEPLGEQDIQVDRDDNARRANITFWMREKPRGRWFLSGPAAPPVLAGPLQASIITRLPAWGRGLAEGSTYYFSLSLLVFSRPIARLLPFAPHGRLLPLAGLARPPLPGQGWWSGFYFSPQLGWKATLAGYGMAQAHRGVRGLLRSDSPGVLPLAVPVEWADGTPVNAGSLVCQPPRSRLSTLRSIGAIASNWLLGAPVF